MIERNSPKRSGDYIHIKIVKPMERSATELTKLIGGEIYGMDPAQIERVVAKCALAEMGIDQGFNSSENKILNFLVGVVMAQSAREIGIAVDRRDNLVGAVWLDISNRNKIPDAMEIIALAVDRKRRRRGYGKQLLGLAEKMAVGANKNVKKIFVQPFSSLGGRNRTAEEIAEDDANIERFYSGMGYVIDEELTAQHPSAKDLGKLGKHVLSKELVR